MESFAVAAAHSGSINHILTFHFNASAVDAARELRLAITVVVIGWVAVTGLKTFWQQRRISRTNHGVRVSRRLPTKGTTTSLGDGTHYSLMQVSDFPEDHPYWGTLRPSRESQENPQAAHTARDIASHKEHARRRTAHDLVSATSNRRYSGIRVRGQQQEHRRSATGPRRKPREKRFGLVDPIAWDAINRSLVQQTRLSSLITPGDTAAESLHQSEIPSRTSSLSRTLNHFTRELQKYANVAGAARKAPIITPTISDSKVSYHTVQPLLPYRDELRAAGLAVTSKEQQHRPARVNIASRNSKVETPPDDKLDELDDDASKSSSSSPTSFVQFTPPDGVKTHLMEPLPPKAKPKPKPMAPEKRRILPWLRRSSPPKETRVNERGSKHPPQSTKDSRVQNKPRISVSPTRRDRGISQVPKSQIARVPGAPSAARPSKSAKLPTKAITPKKAPCVASSPTKAKRSCPGPYTSAHPRRPGPELGTRQPVLSNALQGKRDMARACLTQPETIEEEKESLLDPCGHTIIWSAPHDKATNIPAPITATHQRQDVVSPQTTASTAPSLPYTARFTVSRPSSIERALDAVSHHLEEMEQQADQSPRVCSHTSSVKENVNQKTQYAPQNLSGRRASRASQNPRPRPTEEFVNVARKMPQFDTSEDKPLPPEPLREAPPPPPSRATEATPQEKARAQATQTEDVLKDLDVFFDYDDGDINDRDVIKGLQVAIHAAADNFYDAWVRDKTGLRIRQFLSDLKSVEDMHHANTGDQRARQRRMEARRLQRIQDRKAIPRSDS
ncbi:hypothetical protein F5B20DRAFT_585069 [Whalleya microplaca]|nr:hypothetical protein F5B20DRAFT_585069 [Whalleya microplaca]